MKQSLGLLFLTIVSIAIVEGCITAKVAGHITNEIPLTLLFGLFYCIWINSLIFFLGAFKTFKLPDSHYRIKKFEKNGKLYKAFGVDYIRKVIKHSGAVTFDGKRSSLARLEDHMLFSEKNHTISFGLGLATMSYLAIRDLWVLIPSLLFFSLLIDFYPIITQRYNRARIQGIKNRLLEQ